jgi:PmbA protein
VATELLSVLASMLSSETVQKGKSLLKGRMGQPVVSPLIDIIDDGLLPHGPGTRHIDDEGVPTREHVLIEGGVLRGYMYNTRTAKKDGVASTGNAVRAGYSSVPSVGPMNLYISSRSKRLSQKEMLGSAEAALYVLEAMGVHTANPISGEFSIGVSGLWVEGGRAVYPVKEALVSGNMLDFFGAVQGVGDDLRFLGSMGSPSLLVGPTDISA